MTHTETYTPDTCLKRAQQCVRGAERAASEVQRHQLLWLADQWRHMARLALCLAAAERRVH